jgi:hypothetical protein
MIFPLKKQIFLWSSHDFPIKTPRVSPLGPHRLPSCWMVRAQRQAATRRARGLLRQVWISPLDSLHVEAYLIIYVSLYIYIYGTPPKISGSKFAIVRSYVLDMSQTYHTISLRNPTQKKTRAFNWATFKTAGNVEKLNGVTRAQAFHKLRASSCTRKLCASPKSRR